MEVIAKRTLMKGMVDTRTKRQGRKQRDQSRGPWFSATGLAPNRCRDPVGKEAQYASYNIQKKQGDCEASDAENTTRLRCRSRFVGSGYSEAWNRATQRLGHEFRFTHWSEVRSCKSRLVSDLTICLSYRPNVT